MAQSGTLPPGSKGVVKVLGRGRDDVRSKVRGGRRFHRSGGDLPPRDDDAGGPIWPAPEGPSITGSRLEWPFWIFMLMPWLMLTAGVILNRLQICIMCLPDNVPLPALGP